jgi:MFS family permease
MPPQQENVRRQSVEFSTLQQIDPSEPIRRRSVFRRESFIVQFAKTKGPPQITILMILIAIGLGSTIGVVPAVMSDRFARVNHGYSGQESCSDLDQKPDACTFGFADAQDAAATASLVSNVLTFITSSLIGSLSDEHGRRGTSILFNPNHD